MVKEETVDENTVEARPKHQGKDPLAEGVRLHNVSNSSNAKTYEASENEVDAVVAPSQADGSVAPARPAHKVANKSKADQATVAAGRKEK